MLARFQITLLSSGLGWCVILVAQITPSHRENLREAVRTVHLVGRRLYRCTSGRRIFIEDRDWEGLMFRILFTTLPRASVGEASASAASPVSDRLNATFDGCDLKKEHPMA